MRLPDKIKYLLKGTCLDRETQIDQRFKFLSEHHNINSVEKLNDEYVVELKNGNIISLRGSNSSDFNVFKQIFVFEEYDCIQSILNFNIRANGHNIIDAGANVGLTTLYLNDKIHLNHSFLIEPDFKNFSQCEKNISKNILESKYTLFQNALATKDSGRFKLNRDFRDGQDWSITTEESIEGTIQGITIDSIIDEYSIDLISLLKIDIEGFERFIFKKGQELNFLKKVCLIAIEIHDEFDCRKEIEELLFERNFILFNSGELTIGINKTYV